MQQVPGATPIAAPRQLPRSLRACIPFAVQERSVPPFTPESPQRAAERRHSPSVHSQPSPYSVVHQTRFIILNQLVRQTSALGLALHRLQPVKSEGGREAARSHLSRSLHRSQGSAASLPLLLAARPNLSLHRSRPSGALSAPAARPPPAERNCFLRRLLPSSKREIPTHSRRIELTSNTVPNSYQGRHHGQRNHRPRPTPVACPRRPRRRQW
jgi:hypothetical protein